MDKLNELNRWRKQQSTIVIDSAMERGLEERHYNLDNDLWTAKAVIDAPDKVRDVHRAYFDAGSNVTTVDSYQSSVQGFRNAGYSKTDTERYIKLAVKLAQQGRDESKTPQTKWVAGSVGPYGASLHNGSEYTGDYSLTLSQYVNFHADRFKWLVEAGCDMIEVCTIPNFGELRAICQLLKQFPDFPVSVTCSLRDAHHIPDGTDLRTVQNYLKRQPTVIAYGINCCSPKDVVPALKYLQPGNTTGQDLMVFPNAGARYDPKTKTWGQPIPHVYSRNAKKWRSLGAKWLGGCCTISEAELRRVCRDFEK